LNGRLIAFFGLSLWLGAMPAVSQDRMPAPEQVLERVKKVYAGHCCFKAAFDQVTVNVAMDLKDRFRGAMYVKKPGFISLDVDWPEKQKVVLRGRAYAVYFPADGSAVRGEVPPDLNVEHFFGFFSNIEQVDRQFIASYPPRPQGDNESLTILELTDRKDKKSSFRIVIGIDRSDYTIRRAIIYDALGNYNRFDLSGIQFMSSIPDKEFEISYGSQDATMPPLGPMLQPRDPK
jgi:outer membrane lipoprotein-sorting protein